VVVEGAAGMVQGLKAEPHYLYSIGAGWESNEHTAELDLSVTAKCKSRAHLHPPLVEGVSQCQLFNDIGGLGK